MTQMGKISQRRFLLGQLSSRIPTMPSTKSGRCRPPIPVWPGQVVDMPSEQVDGMLRNQWTTWAGLRKGTQGGGEGVRQLVDLFVIGS
jgi:hypothetical protein